MTNLSDKQIIQKLFAGDEATIQFVFYEKYISLFRFNALKTGAFKDGTELSDLIQELFLYLSKNDWEKLRKYDDNFPFANWLSVVSYRFFKDFSYSLIDSTRKIPIDTLDYRPTLKNGENMISTIMMDIKKAIDKLLPIRDRKIMEMLLLEEVEPAQVAAYFNVTVDNLYNIKRRAIIKLVKTHLHEYAIQTNNNEK